MGLILLIVLILLLFGAFPRSGAYNESWGYAPIGGIGFIVLVIVILLLVGAIPHW